MSARDGLGHRVREPVLAQHGSYLRYKQGCGCEQCKESNRRWHSVYQRARVQLSDLHADRLAVLMQCEPTDGGHHLRRSRAVSRLVAERKLEFWRLFDELRGLDTAEDDLSVQQQSTIGES